MNDFDPSTEAGKFSYGFFKTFLEEKKDQLISFFSRNKVGFLPKGCGLGDLKHSQKKQSFKQLKYLLGEHPTLPIISIGLWINSLPEEDQKKGVEGIRNSIYKTHKKKGVSILNMASTGFMEGFIKFLTNYNLKKNLTKEELIDIYEQSLEDWERISLFIQKNQPLENTVQAIQLKLAQGMPFIYVFASYGAILTMQSVIAQLRSSNLLQQFGYTYSKENLEPKGSKIVLIFEKL